MHSDPSPNSPFRPTTHALAAMQTAINAAGLAFFDSDLDRFGIFALILAQTHHALPQARPIAINSLAQSLGRPFETVRRHVNGLLARGLIARTDAGVAVTAAIDRDPDARAVLQIAHDGFVAFVERLARLELLPPLPAATARYHPMIAIAASVDILLAAAGSNRTLHEDWLSLAIFSAVVDGNARRNHARAPRGGVALGAADAVRASALARALNLPETTVRRRLARLTAPGAPLKRVPDGLIASAEWLGSEEAAATSRETYQTIRLIIARAAVHGFPFDDPAAVYLVGPPPSPFDI